MAVQSFRLLQERHQLNPRWLEETFHTGVRIFINRGTAFYRRHTVITVAVADLRSMITGTTSVATVFCRRTAGLRLPAVMKCPTTTISSCAATPATWSNIKKYDDYTSCCGSTVYDYRNQSCCYSDIYDPQTQVNNKIFCYKKNNFCLEFLLQVFGLTA